MSCKGITKSGKKCKIPAPDGGYCHIHQKKQPKRKCLNKKKYNYRTSEHTYDPKSEYMYICDGETKLIKIGEESSDASVFSGMCNKRNGQQIPVAIKVMNNDPSVELCVLLNKKLRDKDVVPEIFDYFYSNNRYILVMKLLGMSLTRYILLVDNKDEYNDIALKIATNLKYFHDCGFIHGDLHCNNVMIQDHKCYFIDFDRMSSDNTIENDVNTLTESLYNFPLNIASNEYGYESDDYNKVLTRVKLMESLLVKHFNEIYGYEIVQLQPSDSEDDSEDLEDSESD